MKKKIINNFIKDKICITTVYFINTVLIILFFYLYTDGKVQITYPIVLSMFVYAIFIIFEFYRYMKFNTSINKTIENVNYDMSAETNEQKEVKAVISLIHNNYINKISKITEENKVNNKFFSQWIHNMKTPVSVIDLILQKLMKKDNVDYKMLEEIREENNKLLNSLEQVLNMIRIEDFSKDYVPEAVDLYDSLKRVINERKNQFIYNNVFPKLQCEDAGIQILSDAKWNQFMIGQIVSNAIKYSRNWNHDKKESKNIYFDIQQHDKYIVLSIRDEGVGIPDYDLNRVFEPFFTGENGRKYKDSTGIGLYICNVIAEKLGHEVSIESKKGQGACVQIRYREQSSTFSL